MFVALFAALRLRIITICFFSEFSKLLTDSINHWLSNFGLNFNFNDWLMRFPDLKKSRFKDFVLLAILHAAIYTIWINRNSCIFSMTCSSIRFCVAQIEDIGRLSLYGKSAKSLANKELCRKIV